MNSVSGCVADDCHTARETKTIVCRCGLRQARDGLGAGLSAWNLHMNETAVGLYKRVLTTQGRIGPKT